MQPVRGHGLGKDKSACHLGSLQWKPRSVLLLGSGASRWYLAFCLRILLLFPIAYKVDAPDWVVIESTYVTFSVYFSSHFIYLNRRKYACFLSTPIMERKHNLSLPVNRSFHSLLLPFGWPLWSEKLCVKTVAASQAAYRNADIGPEPYM